MKKFISIFICVVMIAFSATGCSFDFDNILAKVDEIKASQVQDKEKNQKEENKIPTYYTIITAIENEDFELFKSVYSDYALEHSVDIEQGFEYICELYTGTFQEVTHSNTGGGTEYFNHSRGSIFHPAYGLRTDEKYYILSFSNWNFPEYESMSGVHCIHLEESTKEETIHVGGKDSELPGILYPENEYVDIIYGRIMHLLSRMEDGKGYGYDPYNVNIKESMSDELLEIDDLDTKVINLQNYFEGFHPSDIELSWRSKDLKSMYFRMDDYESYMYIRFDDEQTEKIKLIQVVKFDKNTPVEEYDFESECGIYLP